MMAKVIQDNTTDVSTQNPPTPHLMNARLSAKKGEGIAHSNLISLTTFDYRTLVKDHFQIELSDGPVIKLYTYK